MGETAPAIVIFGASGDLTQRKLVPALFTLLCQEALPSETVLLGVARSEMDDDAFRAMLFEGVEKYGHLPEGSCDRWKTLSNRFHYLRGDYDDSDTYRRIGEALDEGSGRLFYLATPPTLQEPIIKLLGQSGLNESGAWSRVVIEKPFGRDGASARDLNATVHGVFDEDQVYRIDHYLGKETVQNLLTLRFGNAVFEPLWNRNYVDHIQISVSETVDLGHRAGYYDRSGVMRDMIQNHLLQLLALAALEPPDRYDAKLLRDEKVKVLRSVQAFSQQDALLGQYEGYGDEKGVSEGSRTPTFAAIRCEIDNWRWGGVPFYLRSGKALAERRSEITLQFKDVPHNLFCDAAPGPNRLSIRIQPDEGIHLCIGTKEPGRGMAAASTMLNFDYADRFGGGGLPDAYERLLLDAIEGDPSLFARDDEVEAAWNLVDPLIGWWENGETIPDCYPKGSWGPSCDPILGGRNWLVGCCAP